MCVFHMIYVVLHTIIAIKSMGLITQVWSKTSSKDSMYVRIDKETETEPSSACRLQSQVSGYAAVAG